MKHELSYKTQAEFEEAYDTLTRKWNEEGRGYLYDANCIGINECWVDAMLSVGNYIQIAKTFIDKLRDQRERARSGYHEYEWNIKALLNKYRNMLRLELDKLSHYYLED